MSLEQLGLLYTMAVLSLTEMYYRVVHSRRRLLSKFQPNRTRSFVLTACGIGRVRGF